MGATKSSAITSVDESFLQGVGGFCASSAKSRGGSLRNGRSDLTLTPLWRLIVGEGEFEVVPLALLSGLVPQTSSSFQRRGRLDGVTRVVKGETDRGKHLPRLTSLASTPSAIEVSKAEAGETLPATGKEKTESVKD